MESQEIQCTTPKESFVEVLLTLIQKTNDHELKTQICAVSKVLAAVFGLVSNAEPFHT